MIYQFFLKKEIFFELPQGLLSVEGWLFLRES